jgi:putative N6-adenine-specific DNA methylase
MGTSSSDTTLRKYLATCIPGLATVLAQELEQLGATQVVLSGTAAVQFEATLSTALRILLWVRTAHKLLEFLASTDDEGDDDDYQEPISTPDDLYKFIQANVNVKDLLGDGHGGLLTLAVSVQFNNPQYIPVDLNHSHFTALTIKNALVDRVRDLRGDGTRPDVDIENPQVPLVAVLRGIRPTSTTTESSYHSFRSNVGASQRSSSNSDNGASEVAAAHVSLYRCLHPPISLHKRGYRSGQAIHKAALKESLAAGLLLHAGWDKTCRQVTAAKTTPTSTGADSEDQDIDNSSPSTFYLIDPMAGSGSFVIEAAMIAADLAPGLVRIKSRVPGFANPPILQWKYPTTTTSVSVSLKDEWKGLLRDAVQRAQNGIRALQQQQQEDEDNDEPQASGSHSSSPIQIHANDIHPGALSLLNQSLQQVGLESVVQVHSGDCQTLNIHRTTPSDRSSTLVATNPPWGVRLEADHVDSWDSLRIFLRDVCPSDRTEAWILSGNKDATRHLALKKSQSLSLQTGDHDLRWIQYYIGSRVATTAATTTASSMESNEAKEPTRKYESTRTDRRATDGKPVMRNDSKQVFRKDLKSVIRRAPKPKTKPKPKQPLGEATADSWFIDGLS